MKKTIVGLISLCLVLLSACAAQPAELPRGPDAVWTLIVIGDSDVWELGDALKAQIEKDLGVQVELMDLALAGSTKNILDVLRTRESQNYELKQLPETLEEAQVVVMIMHPNPSDSMVSENPHIMDRCFNSDPSLPLSCNPEVFEQWTADLKAIWAEVFRLRDGKPSILWATDLFNPLVSLWNENGIFEECTQCWLNMSEANRLAADAYNIPFFSRFDAFNGKDHSIDPREYGYIISDGIHPSELMGQYTAELLSQMGYEPVQPPMP